MDTSGRARTSRSSSGRRYEGMSARWHSLTRKRSRFPQLRMSESRPAASRAVDRIEAGVATAPTAPDVLFALIEAHSSDHGIPELLSHYDSSGRMRLDEREQDVR